MRRRRVVMFLLAGAVVVMAVLLSWPREREPEYEGRTLSEWALVYGSGGYPFSVGKPQTPEVKDAVSAIRHIGTNGLPWMLEWVQYQPGPWRKKLSVLTDKLPPALRLADRPAERAIGALVCFQVLGAEANPAIPELIRILNDPKSPGPSRMVAYALSQIGKDALAPLEVTLSDMRAPNRVDTVYAMGYMRELGTNATRTVAALARSLDDPDGQVAATAAWALGNLAVEPDLAVPALALALKSPNGGVRYNAFSAIPRFGEAARPAIPALLQALDSPDRSVRSAATNVLQQIAPQVLP